MACCSPKKGEGYIVDQQITDEIHKQRKDKHKASRKLLLLGAGESGKSTIAKQMKILYLNGYKEAEERRALISTVRASFLGYIKDILRGVAKYASRLPPDIQAIAAELSLVQSSESWTSDLVAKIHSFLESPIVLKVIKKVIQLQLCEHLEYMLAKMDLIASPEYVPTVEDILKVRIHTTGINEINYQLQGVEFSVFDMGGQRSERRKWIHFFDGVNAVIFVLAINEYDLKLREDPTTNRMLEALELFKKVINNELKDTPCILFLNKTDLFRDKITRSELNVCFPDYRGANEYDPALKFIIEKFVSFNMNDKRSIFPHPTCAIDTENMKIVFEDVKATILHSNFRDLGFVE